MSAMFNGLRVTNKNKRNHGVMGIELIKGESFMGILHVQKGGKNIGTTHKTDDSYDFGVCKHGVPLLMWPHDSTVVNIILPMNNCIILGVAQTKNKRRPSKMIVPLLNKDENSS